MQPNFICQNNQKCRLPAYFHNTEIVSEPIKLTEASQWSSEVNTSESEFFHRFLYPQRPEHERRSENLLAPPAYTAITPPQPLRPPPPQSRVKPIVKIVKALLIPLSIVTNLARLAKNLWVFMSSGNLLTIILLVISQIQAFRLLTPVIEIQIETWS